MPITRLKSPEAAARWLREWCTGRLVSDSRQLRAGDAFVAWPGYARDGREFVAQALAAGASTCLVEADGVEAFGFDDARVAALPELKRHTGRIAAEFLGNPTEALDVVAVTGTNGKTSTAWWTAQALSRAGRRCGVVGTLGVGEPPAVDGSASPMPIEFTGLTTPDPVRLQAGFAAMRAAGFAACAIEASSHGIEEHRLPGTRIKVAQFTNLTQDHLDYHGTMAAYAAAKRKLFDWEGLQAAVLHVDDAQGAAWAAELQGQGRLEVWTVGLSEGARLRAAEVRYTAQGLAFEVIEGAERCAVQTGLIGDYNVHNWLGVLGALRALGLGLDEAIAAAAPVTPVPGRQQRIGRGTELPMVVVDYAHTPDALDKALSALKPLAAARGGQLHAVFGCGGDRDRSKRPQMGAIAARLADRVILTSDNPRSEPPEQILADIAAGVGAAPHQVIENRAEAIRQAVLGAAAADVVVVAGKGHEDYQEIQGIKHPFDDSQQARAALIERAGL
ncbi:UDP-N-acetylmuramoyl-L-alanyl-D-glutamate--2,6-diaminopimelate ligase [Inhella inkyongensis]|uniref:UDP-N-acetylmuramoyl-L-alanyl-D-glutamate--2,6-diaminopimelate ligase n=1 Tax=Inhella inkyongensis TaxID=392593 RepID=A0A840S0Z9_9BURK|nr:UDP-N-acetylmuramoyl-L-alanyl-D-glutamate--2,6-diaminopimelate ligase [Inhella inkyongensis]MBB5203443.1 UDP-N-acetylmuramoyl-L-alanyl-D-glutamate--2,6-diaminopimelate ligase [Inhella inkyongensis]